MALDVYFKQDILNALRAAEHPVRKLTEGEQDDYHAGYAEGYYAALATLALAFGLVQVEDER